MQVAPESGIYEIVCLPTGRRYVGSAKNIQARWRGHLKTLRASKASPKFQRAWDKYGEAAFAFRVLERVSRCEDLIRREQFYIDSLHGYTEGLNSRPKAESSLGRIAGPVSEETKAKISRANKIAYKGRQGPMSLGSKHTEDAKKAMSLTKRKTGAKITFNGRSLCLSDWADAVGITLRGLGNRLHRGWPLHRALSERSRGY